MTLAYHLHPLSSYCWKALIALYENDTPFEPHLVDLQDPARKAIYEKLWPLAKIPVLHDEGRGRTVPEATAIIEYLDIHYPGRIRFVPADPDAALMVRLKDRFFDNYVHTPMQKMVGDNMRPEGGHDPVGVAEARTLQDKALDLFESEIGGAFAVGDTLTLADCAAYPPLHYSNLVRPFEATHPKTFAYFKRLQSRPSIARVLKEAEPYFAMFPG